jgi:hypothetical protein
MNLEHNLNVQASFTIALRRLIIKGFYFLVDLDFCEAKLNFKVVGLVPLEVEAPLLVPVGSLEDVDATGSLLLCEGLVVTLATSSWGFIGSLALAASLVISCLLSSKSSLYLAGGLLTLPDLVTWGSGGESP